MSEEYKEIPINPKLPKNFDRKRNEARPQSHQQWWYRPYIVTCTLEDFGVVDEKQEKSWLAKFPTGTRYEVRCLDGGAWDRSTHYGFYATLQEAKKVAKRIQEIMSSVLPRFPKDQLDRYMKFMNFHRAYRRSEEKDKVGIKEEGYTSGYKDVAPELGPVDLRASLLWIVSKKLIQGGIKADMRRQVILDLAEELGVELAETWEQSWHPI
ncbi:MAG: hypothetical protein ACLPX5_13240 [Dissulfurispiraceae bacterium]